jgi:hypothetical protein
MFEDIYVEPSYEAFVGIYTLGCSHSVAHSVMD